MSVIAKVNGEEITSEMLDTLVARYVFQLNQEEDFDFEINDENYKYIKTELLNEIITRTLLLQLAERLNIGITNDEVYNAIDSMKKEYSSIDEWEDDLKKLNLNDTLLFNEIKNDLIIDKLINNYLAEIEITDDEVKEFYEYNKEAMKEPDSFTFYEVSVSNKDDVKKIYEIYKNYEDSEEMTNKINELDYEVDYNISVKSYDLSEELIKVLSSLEIGGIGTMPNEDDTILVIKLDDKKIGKHYSYDEIKDLLKETLKNNLYKEVYDKITENEFENADIEYIDMEYLKKKK